MRGEVSGAGLSDALLALGKKDGVVPLKALPGLYHRKLGRQWEFWVNPQPLQTAIPERPGQSLFPRELYVEFNGWPFAVIDCATGDGWAGDGELANLAAFVAALQEASK